MSHLSPILSASGGDVAACQTIDEEIAELEARIISLKTLRNTCTLFARLHPEIIQEIFLTACQSCWEMTNPTHGKRTPLEISWVCSMWRDLALQTSALWNRVGFLNAACAQTFLSRAKNRSLEFSIFLPVRGTRLTSHIAALCLGNLPRMRVLSILSNRMDIFPRQSSMWATPAPLLVLLQLKSVSLPPDNLAGTFPSLQILRMHECDFQWASIPLHPGIQELCISAPVLRISADDLVQKIRVIAPNVRKLQLWKALLPTVATRGLQPPHRYKLNCIEFCEFSEEPAGACGAVLSQISLSSQLNYAKLAIHGGSEQLDTIREFITSRGINERPIAQLVIFLGDKKIKIKVADARESSTHSTIDHGQENHVQGQNKWRYRSVTIDNFEAKPSHIMPLFQILPFSSVKILKILKSCTADYGPYLLNHFNAPEHGSVEVLEISTSYLPTFNPVIDKQNQRLRKITGLIGNVKDQELDDDMRVACRDVLMFHRLRVLVYFGEAVAEKDFAPSQYTILHEWLCWRRIAGLGIEELVFTDIIASGPPEDYVTALFADVVSFFRCERDEEGEYDSDDSIIS